MLRPKSVIDYYDKFSKVYDIFSSKSYYHKARSYAVKELELKEGHTVLNVPCGTGQNFEYFQEYLRDSGLIIGVDLSPGMLEKAISKQNRRGWENIALKKQDVTKLDQDWILSIFRSKGFSELDAILCDLGLSCFPDWQRVMDNLISLLKPWGRIVLMDWYLDESSLRGELLQRIGKGEVNRPIWQYMKTVVDDFKLESSFNRGGVFVASGHRTAPEQ